MPCSARTALAVEQFRFEVDAVFELLGPRAKVFACTLGLPCTIELPGHEVRPPRGGRGRARGLWGYYPALLL